MQPPVHVILNIERQLFPLLLRFHIAFIEEVRLDRCEVHFTPVVANLTIGRLSNWH